MRKVILGSILISVSLVTACGRDTGQAQPDALNPTTFATPVAPEPTGSTNIIDETAAKAYREALQKSLAAQSETGLTEIWKDPDGNLAQVVSFDVASQKGVQHDIIADEAQELGGDAMMPTVLLDELDALEGNASTDRGSVTSQKTGTFTVLNYVDDSKYVSVYTVDDQGRLASAQVSVDDELSAIATFTYSVTAEGKTAFAKLK